MSLPNPSWLDQLPRLPRWARVAILVAVHAVLFTVAYLGAFALRFDFAIPERFEAVMWQGLLPMLGIKLAVFAGLKMFQGWWKYVSLYDVVALTRALVAASGAWLAMNVLVMSPEVFPRSIYILDFVLCLFVIGSARGGIRLVRESIANHNGNGKAIPVLIAGAGDTGEALMREISRNKKINYRPVGFLDDDPYKQGLRVHGVKVLGPMEAMPALVEQHNIEEVILAMPSASREAKRRVIELAHRADVTARTVPAFELVVEGRVSVNQIREVAITDLLGRPPVELDTAMIGRFLEDRTVLVTGAGGSIGSEICRQVLRFNPARVVMVDCAETPLFSIHRELRDNYDEVLEPTIGDVTDGERMRAVFQKHRPDVILHAAAYKHVPLMERHPAEAVRNNVRGTRVVADLADEFGVESFVLISTDKAVNPTSVMGATKRVSELYVRHLDTGSDTNYSAVRFGNVLGSNGSVIPIFRQQIKDGGPVTVTHPEMTRYFMTIPEATQLVLQAASFETGDLFILDMGEPVKIMDLARDMIRLSGFTEDEIPIEIIGMRPGEKLFEELALDCEELDRTRHNKIFAGDDDGQVSDDVLEQFKKLLEAGEQGANTSVIRGLDALIPGYETDDVVDESQQDSDKIIEINPAG